MQVGKVGKRFEIAEAFEKASKLAQEIDRDRKLRRIGRHTGESLVAVERAQFDAGAKNGHEGGR